jgi:hypothetical protein
MQTTYASVMTPAIAGMALLAPRKSRPRQLAKLPQILSLTIANGAGTDNVSIVATDTRTGQSWTLPAVTGSANEATLGAAIRAAVAADPKFNSLFTVAAVTETNASDIVHTWTARSPYRSFTLVATGGPVSAATVSTATESQAAGGSGLAFGQLVAKGTNDDEFVAMTSTTTVEQIAGMLFRTDANHFHALPADLGDELSTESDVCPRGQHMAIAEDGEFWVTAAEAVTPASRCYVRVEGSTVGDWGDTPAGTAQVLTVTPIVDLTVYGFAFTATVNGRAYRLRAFYRPTDGTTAIADACAGLLDSINTEITSYGLGSFLTAADNSTDIGITGAAGVLISELSANVWSVDTEVTSVTMSATSADVDMLDVSSICRYTSTAAAGALVKVKLQLQP